MSLTLRLSQDVYDTLIQTAAVSPEREICGFLYGHVNRDLKEGEQRTGSQFISIPNIAERSSEFQMDPLAVVDTLYHIKGDLVSIVHSHPFGRYHLTPSVQDVRNHWSEDTWSIILYRNDTHWDIACYRITAGTYTKVKVEVDT